MTTRHHDGYALWPSEYGDFSTREHMGGRDLLRPYVEACRRHGIKVGFYYSPGNWLFNPPGWPYLGYPLRKATSATAAPSGPSALRVTPTARARVPEVLRDPLRLCKGQVRELLTNYGKIDLLWWDGYDWPKVDIHGPR